MGAVKPKGSLGRVVSEREEENIQRRV